MTAAEVNRAAKIYTLAMAAHSDGTGADTKDEARVMRRASRRAEESLERLGISINQVCTISDCIALVKAEGRE